MVNLYRDPKGENIFKAIAPPKEIGEEKKKLRRRTRTLNLNTPITFDERHDQLVRL